MNHIALLLPTLDRIGGAERQVLLLAQGLARRGWRVTVVTLSGDGGDEAPVLSAHGIGFLSLEMRKGLADPRGWFALNRWLRREKPDVLHAHLPHAAWMARWSRLFAHVPVIVDTIHTAGTGTVGRRIGYRVSGWLSDRTTAVSRGAAEAWLAAHMGRARKLTVLPNGVDTEQWKPDAAMREETRRRLGLREEFLWLAAGRLEPVKDFATLLCAFAGLPAEARLIVAGSGSQRGMLESLARKLAIAERVSFPGQAREVMPLMQAADGFALSSLWEGLPMSLLEAAACALPAVSTSVAGAAEILGPEQRDHLACIRDPDSLRAAMDGVMRHSAAERERIGQSAREHVQQHYGLSAVIDRWEALYLDLLAPRKSAVSRRKDAAACEQDAGVDAT